MTQKKNNYSFVSEEVKHAQIQKIIGFFQEQRNEKIGVLFAEDILDFFLSSLGEEVYRRAILDTKKLVRDRSDDLEIELDLLLPSSR